MLLFREHQILINEKSYHNKRVLGCGFIQMMNGDRNAWVLNGFKEPCLFSFRQQSKITELLKKNKVQNTENSICEKIQKTNSALIFMYVKQARI